MRRFSIGGWGTGQGIRARVGCAKTRVGVEPIPTEYCSENEEVNLTSPRGSRPTGIGMVALAISLDMIHVHPCLQ